MSNFGVGKANQIADPKLQVSTGDFLSNLLQAQQGRMANSSVWDDVVGRVETGVDQWMDGAKPYALTDGLPMMDVSTMLAFEVGYMAMLLFGIPIMKQMEKPFELKTIKLLHNLFLFGLSLYMCVETIRQAILGGYKVFGNDMEKGTESHAQGMSRIVYVFYVSKAYEFLDTAIMILCKKFNQVSFLHVYHHATIFAIWWAIAKYAPGGDAYFSVILNSFVHTVMYAYYFFSSQGFGFVKPIKPYITTLQMTQFMAMLVQSLYDYLFPCDYPQALVQLLGVYMITLLALFGNFFVQSYLKKPKKSKTN
uniref:Elongation of fatty acids protein n=1 Tax=Parietichytrium sp. TaxID=1689869 RepID=A0A809VKD6_9STRA|nr:C18/C20 elongase [Parietichytrium sp.]